MSAPMAQVCVIGGGAAGFYSAIACAQAVAARTAAATCKPSLRRLPGEGILILEQSAEVLHKVRISGGGRCNVTHENKVLASNAYPRGGELVAALSMHHGPHETARWFEAHGVPLKTESDGRIFPTSNKSASVVDCLRETAEMLGVRVQTGTKVVSATSVAVVEPASPAGARFRLNLEACEGSQSEVACGRVIFCCGSAQKRSVKRLLEGLGATLCPTAPSLFSLLLHGPEASGLEGLQGVSVPDALVDVMEAPQAFLESNVSRPLPSARGPVLITHTGLSGPAILRLSAWGAYSFQASEYQALLRIHWAPFLRGPEELAEAIRAVPAGHPDVRGGFPVRHKSLNEVSPWPGRLPARLWGRLLDLCSVDAIADAGLKLPLAKQPWGHFESPQVAQRLASVVWPLLSGHNVQVNGRRVNKEEFVTAGGVDWRTGVDWGRMESTRIPGVHFAGEVLDVDGITGGFNFQGCWSSGYVAGRAAAADAFDI